MRHDLVVLHGWVLGGALLVGSIVALIAFAGMTAQPDAASAKEHRLFSRALWGVAALSWLASLSGAYIAYPWYRAKPPAGTADLSFYPRSLLLSHPETSWWHGVGMEWKEHIAWIAPIGLTMLAYVFSHYGSGLARQRAARSAGLAFLVVSFISASVAGGFGLLLARKAPVLSAAPTPVHVIGESK